MRHGSRFTFRLPLWCTRCERDERRSEDFIQRSVVADRLVGLGRSDWRRSAMLVLWLLVPPVDSACSATSSRASFWLHPKGATFVSISAELEAKILRYYHVEKRPAGTIAQQLQVHHGTVQRVLRRAGVPPPQRTARVSKADPYVPFIRQTLERFPTLTASRVYAMVRERGYRGSPDHFRHIVAMHRPRRAAEA